MAEQQPQVCEAEAGLLLLLLLLRRLLLLLRWRCSI